MDLYGKCPYATARKVLAGKWSILALHLTSDAPVRLNELLRRLPRMTHATLPKQLKRLEESGLVVRKEFPQVPPKVEYSLSEIGEKFQPVLDSLEAWGDAYIAFMEERDS